MYTKHITTPKIITVTDSGLLRRLLQGYLNHLDGQKQNRLLWFFMALMFHGVFFLASPAILIGYFNAPVIVLAITIINFFVNLIANMGGASIRTTLTMFYLGMIINIGMILLFVL